MRFHVASIEHAKTKAKLLKTLLDALGMEVGLTPCQATVARCLGYASWAELKSSTRATPSPVDEEAGIELWRERIARQCQVIEQDFDIDPCAAAGVTLALRLTSRARSADTASDLGRFEPRGLGSLPAPLPARQDEVSVWLIQWTEHERDWGQRPDGYSLHATADAAVSYVRAFRACQPKGPRPAEYSEPETDAVEVRVPSGHPVMDLLSRGVSRVFWGDELSIVRGIWPANAGGWQSIPV